jgi:hypothetical protein
MAKTPHVTEVGQTSNDTKRKQIMDKYIKLGYKTVLFEDNAEQPELWDKSKQKRYVIYVAKKPLKEVVKKQ